MILRSQFMTSRRMNRSQNAVLSEGNTHGGRRYYLNTKTHYR
ncbi:hypothetical protein HMPREF1987_01775 [Peptostreptococcaceae bacterium oral taxon 113 str. W5053]|nr:hypothetical protein HMPREF1987_01775 [Peptostreptococcaceae bacterium oral taxon 113 str. W5053]